MAGRNEKPKFDLILTSLKPMDGSSSVKRIAKIYKCGTKRIKKDLRQLADW